jgi:DNA-binding NarL/FixJ family response regulator
LAERLARAATSADGFDADLVLATALAGEGRCDDAETLLADLERRAVDDGQRAQAALRRSDNLSGGLGEGSAARTVLAEALEAVSTSPWRESLLAASARLELFGGDARTALAMVTQLLEQGEHDPDVLLEVWPLGAWGRILCGMPLAALQFCDELLPVAAEQRGGQHGALAPGLVSHSRCAAAIMAGRLRDADRWSQETDRLSTTTGAAASRGIDGFTRGWTLRVIGRLRSAAEILEEAVLALGEIDLFRHRSACLGELAHCFALLGDLERATAAVAEADTARVASFVLDYAYVEGAKAWLAHASGEHSYARHVTIERARHCVEHGHLVFAAFAWHDLTRFGEPSDAVEPLEALAAQVEGALIPTFHAHASALAAGDAPALDRVAVAFEQIGAILYAAEAAAAAAGQHRQAGRTGSALTSAAHARRLIVHCEGARTPAIAALDTSLPLTARELEIATLAALGHTNRNIAERLVVSVRTVDNHLHNTYAKLGITRRSQLAAILLPAQPAD